MSELVEESDNPKNSKSVRLGPRRISIPVEWDALPFEEAIELNPRYDKPDEGPFDYLPMDAVDEDKQTIEYWTQRQKKDCTTTWFKNGDTVYAKITPSTENGKIAFIEGLDTKVGSGSTEFLVFHPREDVTFDRFVYYLVNLPHFRSVTISLMEGSTGRQRVPTDVFKGGVEIPIPPFSEQRRIAEIFSTIDKQIQQTDETITKTKELKRGLRQNLLLRGLGNEKFQKRRLGLREVEMPESWEVRSTKDLFNLEKEGFDPTEHSSEVYLYSMPAFDEGETPELTATSEIGSKKRIVPQDTILFPKLNIRKKRFWRVQQEHRRPAICSTEYWPLTAKEGVCLDYFKFYFNSHQFMTDPKLSSSSSTNSHKRVSQSSFEKVNLPLPPIKEQKRIAMILETTVKKFQEEQEKKAHLKELKRGLMQDLLTGKVRVNPKT